MNTEDYNNKMLEHLACGSYRKLSKDPGKKFHKIVHNAIINSNLDDDLKKKLLPKEGNAPWIYGLPKIHKNGTPLRPIVNTIGSPTYKLAKYLAILLKPLVGQTNSFVKDSTSWVQDICNETLEANDILVSFDLVSLYTKIPVDEAITTIRNLTDDDTAKLVEVCLKTTFFTFQQVFLRTSRRSGHGLTLVSHCSQSLHGNV